MEFNITESGLHEFRKVFVPVIFRTEDGQVLSICMRNDGFEINSNGANLYYAVDGKISPISSGKGEKTKGHEDKRMHAEELIKVIKGLLEIMHDSSWCHITSHSCDCKGCRIEKAKALIDSHNEQKGS